VFAFILATLPQFTSKIIATVVAGRAAIEIQDLTSSTFLPPPEKDAVLMSGRKKFYGHTARQAE
jgi:hypothetical protein